jgi:trehalose 6-phosphate phosphatase
VSDGLAARIGSMSLQTTPQTPRARAGLRAVLDSPADALIACDFDGTLSPIVDDPEAAYAEPGATEALSRLSAHVGTVAILTGRPVAAVRRLAGLDELTGTAELEVLGQYGVERWDAATGQVLAPQAPATVARARAALPRLLASLGVDDAHLEDKGRAIGVHVRRAADPEGTYARLREPLETFAGEHGLHLEPGKLVLELRAPGTDKGGALRELVDERGARAVVYAGDDLGDLAAYDAVEDMRAKGMPGLLVYSLGAERTALADHADILLDGPPGLVAWLTELADRLDD